MSAAKSKAMCRGCRDDFYNGTGATECWAFKKARVVTRWRLGWWTRPVEPCAYTEVETLDCHHAPGKYALHKQPHPEAVDPIRLAGSR